MGPYPKEGSQHCVLHLVGSWLGIFVEVQQEVNAEEPLIPVTAAASGSLRL